MTELAISRAEEVRQRIEGLRTNLVDNMFDLGELLLEARDNRYHEDWGFTRFSEYIEASGVAKSERQVYYLITIAEKSKALGIGRDQLKGASRWQLNEIFSLDPDTKGDDIKQLLAGAPEQTLEETKLAVQSIKKGEGAQLYSYLNLKVSKDAKEFIIDPAIEEVRAQYGNTIDSVTGEYIDISPGKAIEMICADYMSGVRNERQDNDNQAV